MRTPALLPTGLTTGLLTGLLLLCLLATGCSSDTERRPTAVSASPTPIERLNTTSMRLARVRFCAAVPTSAVRAALAGASTQRDSWGNGDKADVETGLDDVVHENGCRWQRSSSGGATSASAWLFTRAVTAAEAATIVSDAGRHRGCRASSATTFGAPSVRQACRLGDGSRRVRTAGLFGDTWLSCEVSAPATTPATAVRARADAWCVQIANVLNVTR